MNDWDGAVLTGGAQTALTIWIGRHAAFRLLSLPSSPSQQKALRCQVGDGTTAIFPDLDACKEAMKGISNLEREVLLSGSKPLVFPCRPLYQVLHPSYHLA